MGPGQIDEYRFARPAPQHGYCSPVAVPTLIFGGSFDPPHRRHVEVALEAAKALRCSRLVVVPSARSPLKEGAPRFPDPTRLAMASAAFDVPAMRDAGVTVLVEDVELRRGGTSFTVDTLRTLTGTLQLAQGSTWLLVGSDQALQFAQWRDWGAILADLAQLAVVARPPHRVETLGGELARSVPGAPAGSITVLPIEPVDLSSTVVRAALESGQIPLDLLPPGVAALLSVHSVNRWGR